MANEQSKDLVKLDGTIIKSDGKQVKTNYFSFLDIDIDQYQNVTYTREEANRIRTHMSHLSTGAAAAVPLICPGAKLCPFVHNCPFVREDINRMNEWTAKVQAGEEDLPKPQMTTPVGKKCLVEVNLLNQWTRYYIEEFQVPEDSFVELQMCRELAEIELMEWRINSNLSKPHNAELVTDEVVGIDKEGNVLTKQAESAFFTIKNNLSVRRNRLRKLMVGDRQEKYKREAALKQKQESDPSSSAAQLRGEINRLLKQAEGRLLALQEKEGNVIDSPAEETVTPEDLINQSHELHGNGE